MLKSRIETLSKLSIYFLCLVISITLINLGCTNSDNIVDSEAGNPKIISTLALINLPTSIAGHNTKRSLKSDKALEIYTYIRLQNFFVNELINGESLSVRNIINEFIATLPWNIIKQRGRYSTDSSSLHFEASYNESDSLPYFVTIENQAPSSYWKIKSYFNGSAEYPKGWFYYFIDAPPDTKTDSLEMLVFFEKAQTYRTMDIQIDQNLLAFDKILAQSFKYSWFEQNGIIHLSGSSYHPFIDSILTDVTGHCYSYTAVIDTQNNLSKVNLGIPPADYNDTLLHFTDYGIANMYGNYFINYEIPPLNDSLKMILATSYKDSLTIEQIYYHLYTYELVSQILGILKTDTSDTAIESYINQDVPVLSDSLKHILATSYMDNLTVSEIIFRIIINPGYTLKPASAIDSITVEDMRRFIRLNYKYVDGTFKLHDPSEVSQMTVDDLTYFLALNTKIINPGVKLQYKTLLWILKLEQPVYFNSRGYAGNGSVPPTGFEELSKVQCNRALFKPSDIKNLVIDVE